MGESALNTKCAIDVRWPATNPIANCFLNTNNVGPEVCEETRREHRCLVGEVEHARSSQREHG